MAGWMMGWTAVAGSLAAFLAAAKSHGRQIRLERELAGHWKVVFGGENPPMVEALWRRDRILFWSVFAAVLLGSLAYGLFASRHHGRLPLSGSGGQAAWWGLPFLALAWAFILAFLIAGLTSAVRTYLAIKAGATQGDAWLSGTILGSLAWWGLVLGLVTGLATVLLRSQGR